VSFYIFYILYILVLLPAYLYSMERWEIRTSMITSLNRCAVVRQTPRLEHGFWEIVFEIVVFWYN
jgi:hypothetical protein